MAVAPTPVASVSEGNSTSATLLANAIFTGASEDVLSYALVSVMVYASHASATDGLEIQWSSDGTNWDDSEKFTIPATTGKTFSAGVQARYFRVKYTNGGTNQTAFRLQALYHNTPTKGSSHRCSDIITAENDAELVLAVPIHIKALKSKDFSLTTTGNAVAAVSGKRLKVFAYKLVCSAAITVNFRDGATTALEGGQAYAANGGAAESVPPPAWLFATTAGNGLDVVISGTGTAAGRISYWDDDAS